jgi:predicted Zn-dependent protease
MIGPEHAKELLHKALRASRADQTEALLFAQEMELTRFANNLIHQNVAEADVTLTIRAVVGKRQGVATTNNLSDAGIARAVEAARQAALNQPEDPDFPGLPGPHLTEPVRAFDEDAAAASPEERAKAVGVVCAKAKAQNITASGAFHTGTQEIALANSHGSMGYQPSSFADFQVTALTDDSAGRARASAWKLANINPEAVGDEALGKAARGRNPRKIEPGEFTVVVDPYATLDLVNMLNWMGVSAQAVQEGRSWMIDRMGKPAMSPLVSIWDDGNDPAGRPLPFDFEGVTRQRVEIVSRGVIGQPVYDSYYAAKEGKQSTGHALPAGQGMWSGPMALNLFMAPGDQSVEEMIRSTERGLYITSFWYTRPMHPRDCVVTGMTRDGVFMIENGELSYPVKNLRFTQSYVQALADVERVGREVRLFVSEFGSASRVPALKIKAFNFTGSTV